MLHEPANPYAALIGTAILSLVTGYFLGLGSSIGFLPNPFGIGNSHRDPRRGTITGRIRTELDTEESSSSDIDDDVVLDNAPNWANGEEADRRQGLRARTAASSRIGSSKQAATRGRGGPLPIHSASGVLPSESTRLPEMAALTRESSGEKIEKPLWEESNEECKLVLVVRTDLGMTKGKIAAQCSHATLACYKSLSLQTPKSRILSRWERYGQAKVALQVKTEEDMFDLQAKAMSLGITAEIIADAGRTQIASGSHTVLGIGPAPKSVIDAVTGHLKLL